MPERLSPERWRVVIPYLDRALGLDGGQRDSWLLALREEDAALAGDVAALLEKHERLDAQGYLDAGVDGGGRRTSLAGQVLGAYTLREPIGQGGMGSVWLADRTDGRYRGAAAVKLLNPSLLGREGESRFRREGSILARLRHPNIAQLIDAGVSPAGQPYLVLEHVDGQRIDRYCDDRMLSVEPRVRLFLDVLSAVAHAHANLVIHRDLKPSNVMVDADGRVKLLDFGIAKLVGPEPGEATALTGDGAHVMTPQYAAPEQLAGGDVSTATDVYALGALLYLLVTGCHPSGSETGSPAELIRAIVETEPARPSEAVLLDSPDADTAGERASRRSTTPKKLAAALRGDLDNILAKALKKAPSERYATVEALAADLRAHLAHQVVGARADSLRYRAGRFLRRHRVASVATVVLFLSLAVGLGATAWQYARARRETARAQAVTDFLIRLFQVSGQNVVTTDRITAREILDQGVKRLDVELADQPAMRASLLSVMGRVHNHMGLQAQADDLLSRSEALLRAQTKGDDPELARVLRDLSDVRVQRRECESALALARESVEMARRLYGGDHQELADSLQALAHASMDGPREPAEARMNDALAMRRRLYGEAHRDVVQSVNRLGMIAFNHGDYALAEARYREALRIALTVPGDSFPAVPESMVSLGATLTRRGRPGEAVGPLREAVRLYRERLGSQHSALPPFLRALATALRANGEPTEAGAIYQEALAIQEASLDPGSLEIAKTTFDIATLRLDERKPAEAEALYRRSVSIMTASMPPGHPYIGKAMNGLGAALNELGRHAEAESLVRPALGQLTSKLPPGHDLVAGARIVLGQALVGERRRLDEAQAMLEQGVAVYRAQFGAADVRTAEASLVLAECLLARGGTERARALAHQSLAVLAKARGETDSRTVRARRMWAAGEGAEARRVRVSVRDAVQDAGKPQP
jgi:serine/threonine-protein kinase